MHATRLIVPIVAPEPPLARQLDAARAAGADMAELRLDLLTRGGTDRGPVAQVEALLGGPRALPVLVTVRAADEGGEWRADEAERVALLSRLAELRPDAIDVELATLERHPALRAHLERVRARGGAAPVGGGARSDPPTPEGVARPLRVVSRHVLAPGASDAGALLDSLAGAGGDVSKLAVAARDATDALRMLDALRARGAPGRVIALAMGDAGLAARILARKFGAFATFAAASAQHASAPGQPTIDALRGLYRWDAIGPATRVFGVVGWPLAHSLSPLVHNAALEAAAVDAVYVPLPVEPTEPAFAAFMDYVSAAAWLDLHGLSVTLPHKEHALHWLAARRHAIEPSAQRVGAVNTLTRSPPGDWCGANTDVEGLQGALSRAAGPGGLRGLRARVLGAGGAARAAVAALQDLGCEVTVFNRTVERAAALARELGCGFGPWEARAAGDWAVLINATSVGMWPDVDDSPMPPDALRPGSLVLDAVYRPARTRLLGEAAQAGCRVVSGVEMFMGQALGQFARWHGTCAAGQGAGAMRAALERRAGD